MSALLLMLTALSSPPEGPPFTVRVDERRHEVVIRMGPFPLPANEAGAGEEHEGMGHAHGSQLPVYRFPWPVSGWVRGFRVTILDGNGNPLDRRLLHHVNLLHLDRRSLTLPMFEKTMAAGQETEAVTLPKSVGVRIEKGADMGLASMWTNETGGDLPGVVLELALPYLPENTVPEPLDVRPIAMDVGFRPGLTAGFDLDSGRKEFSREFILPVSGRLLGVGGHLHDYGLSLELRDAESGKVLVTLRAKTRPDGTVLGMSRKVLGVSGAGLKLKAGRRYLVVAKYYNPTGRVLKLGAMAAMAGIFAPDDPKEWPVLERNHPVYLAEIASLDEQGWVSIDASGKPRPPDER